MALLGEVGQEQDDGEIQRVVLILNGGESENQVKTEVKIKFNIKPGRLTLVRTGKTNLEPQSLLTGSECTTCQLHVEKTDAFVGLFKKYIYLYAHILLYSG